MVQKDIIQVDANGDSTVKRNKHRCFNACAIECRSLLLNLGGTTDCTVRPKLLA